MKLTDDEVRKAVTEAGLQFTAPDLIVASAVTKALQFKLESRSGFGGHYDETGRWVQTKHCFVSCGSRCDCQPPNGVYQLPPKTDGTPGAPNNERKD